MGRSAEEWLPKYYAAFVIEYHSTPCREAEKSFQLTISQQAGLTLLKWRMTYVHKCISGCAYVMFVRTAEITHIVPHDPWRWVTGLWFGPPRSHSTITDMRHLLGWIEQPDCECVIKCCLFPYLWAPLHIDFSLLYIWALVAKFPRRKRGEVNIEAVAPTNSLIQNPKAKILSIMALKRAKQIQASIIVCTSEVW